jgi:hypothetical protein
LSRALVPSKVAIDRMREADARWASALRGLASYPDRLRTFAEAAEEQSRALTLADLANVGWKPRPGARKLRFPFEVDPTGERPGPGALWGKFDRAVKQLGVALEGDSIKPIAEAFAQLSALAGELADSLEAEGLPSEGQRQAG